MEAVAGAKIIYLYRLLEEQRTEDGKRMAFVTEDSISYSKDADATATKDGSIRTPSPAEVEKNITAIMGLDDPMVAKLKSAMLNDKLIELWEANLASPVTGKTNQYHGTYFQGYVTSYELTANAEDMAEISMTIGVNGSGVDGNVTVDTSQQEDASYAFVDTPAVKA